MEQNFYTDLIAGYLSGNIRPAEQEQLLAWIEADPEHRAFFEEMLRLWSISGQETEVPIKTDTDRAWAALEMRLFGGGGITNDEKPPLQSKPSAKIRPLSIKNIALRVAAVILLAIAIGIWWLGGFKSESQQLLVETGAKERREIVLPDGSEVWLNENTRLTYERSFRERVVTLEGEAFFDITRQDGQTFTILSGGASTVVLGTSFNVRAYPTEDRIEVTVATGRVALGRAAADAEPVLLEAGVSGIFDKTTHAAEVITEPVSNADAWKNMRLQFDDVPVRQVLEAMERYFSIRLEVANNRILKCPLTGDFPNPRLEDMLNRLSFALDLQITQQDSTTYSVQGRGCE